jgi:hypothetical protein
VKIMKNCLKAPKIFRCAANFRLRRSVIKGLKHPPLITLTADPAGAATIACSISPMWRI